MAQSRSFGSGYALASAATFGTSGIFAASLMDSGWSPGATTTLRVTFAALVLLIPTLIVLRGRFSVLRSASRHIVLYGALAIAGTQLCFFAAVQYMQPSIALLIEFLGPVLLVGWHWAISRKRPHTLTLIGAGLALLGLAFVCGIIGEPLHPVGVMFGLAAAVGVACYFELSASVKHEIPPLALAGGGTLVAAVILGLASVSGLLPFHITTETTTLIGTEISVWLVLALLVLIATVAAYTLGIAGARRIGSTLASFLGYSEVVFAFIWTWLLLGLLPGPMQWIGGACILLGVVVVKLGQLRAGEPAAVTQPNPLLEMPEMKSP
ncbi:EamA family transporter [Humidisolicoccus flavus]|uniref:EamA family transporter n=1 Tax=Humidisolicoccus flavus TaxID=3111414 RepID=UPI003247104D